MNIVIIYQFFQSEDEPGHSLTYNLTQNLALKGNKVTVVCSKIGYMKGNTANLSFKQKLFKHVAKKTTLMMITSLILVHFRFDTLLISGWTSDA